jgi:3-hydroxypropanoate dehydrogenase
VRKMLDDDALDTIFRAARTHNVWRDEPVSLALLQSVYELTKFGPTSANCCPARFVFLTTPEAKKRLEPHLIPDNKDKTMKAPATVIVAYDLKFYDKIPQLFPHNPGAKSWFDFDEKHAFRNAFRNGSLQGAYFLIAARALGLDCGPMSGFDNAGVDKEFFDGTDWRSNFLINLGHGDESALFPRSPRLSFEEACLVL